MIIEVHGKISKTCGLAAELGLTFTLSKTIELNLLNLIMTINM